MSVGDLILCEDCGFPFSWLDGDRLCEDCRPAPPASNGFTLRPYQEECTAAILRELADNDSTLALMATGTGKTVVFATVGERWPDGRILILVHRDELARQTRKEVEKVTSETCDVEMGEAFADQTSHHSRSRFIVTSVQTMSRRRRQCRFHPDEFSLLIIDEAHHAVAKSYKAVVEYFQPGGLKVLGVTATADRTDEVELGKVFESVAYEYPLPDAIEDGWLVPIHQDFAQVTGLDLSQIPPQGNRDFSDRQIEKIMKEERICQGVASAVVQIGAGRSTLVFSTGVDSAELTSEIINRHRSGTSEWICGDKIRCPLDQRRDTLRRFGQGDLPTVANYSVLLEGFDAPIASLLANGRPTKSRLVYAQTVGRVTRPLPGVVDGLETPEERRAAIAASAKPYAVVLDFVGNSGQHKLVSTADILGGKYEDDIVAEATFAARQAATRGERTDMLEELRAAEQRQIEKRRQQREHIVAKATVRRKRIDPFDVFDILPKREPGWHKGRKPTAKQLAFLEKSGVETEDVSFVHASQLIGTVIERRKKGLCTFKQGALLQKYGEETEGLTFKQASQRIEAIKQNGWKPLTK